MRKPIEPSVGQMEISLGLQPYVTAAQQFALCRGAAATARSAAVRSHAKAPLLTKEGSFFGLRHDRSAVAAVPDR